MFKKFLSIKCTAYGQTDTGRARNHNEDNIRLNNEHHLYIVADGMGGHQAGEVASKMAIKTIEAALLNHQSLNNADEVEFPEIQTVTQAIEDTNVGINQSNKDRGLLDGKGMGTTVVGCWYLPRAKMSVIFNVGDSRAYSFYKNELTQITTDHSLLQLWKDKCFEGDEPPANVLTKALGPYADVAPDILLYPGKKSEMIILCSDGLTTMVDNKDIEATLREFQNSPDKIPEQLIAKANQAGGEDNISVVAIVFS